MYLADRSPLSGQSKFGKNTVKRLKTDSNEVRRIYSNCHFAEVSMLLLNHSSNNSS